VSTATVAQAPADRSSPAEPTTTGRVTRLLLGAVHLYQLLRSGRPTGCRYLPSCSSYAEEAILRYGPITGLRLTVGRLARCHPWGGHGLDPVPDRSAPCHH
jgi:putative membrane protein insertion efficiency factor